MYTQLIVMAVLGLVLPYALLRIFGSPKTQIVFEGNVAVSTIGLLGKTAMAKGYDYLTAVMPDGTTLVFEETRAQIAKLNSRFGIGTTAHVVVSRSLFGKREISSVTWPGETAPRAALPSNRTTYLGVLYFMLGLAALVYSFMPDQPTLVQPYGVGYGGLLLVISGWVLGMGMLKTPTEEVELRFLCFSLGKGRKAFYPTTLVVSAITVACFYAGGIFVLLGINTAVTTGIFLAQLVKKTAKS